MNVKIDQLSSIFLSVLGSYGITNNAKIQTMLNSSTGLPSYDIYLDNKFRIDYSELSSLDRGELPESFKSFINDIENCNFYAKLNRELKEAKEEIERLKPFETYYTMQMQLNKAAK